MATISMLSEFDEFSNVVLDINAPFNTRIETLMFQPCGDLSFSHETGIKYETDAMRHKANSFISFAKELKSSLVLTPEGSIGIEIIIDIISDEDRWPDIGKLWCLCSTGISIPQFHEICQDLSKIPNAYLIMSKISFERRYINSIWYLFKISDHRLGIVIQHKTFHMKDLDYSSEAEGLSFGDNLFVFDLAGNDSIKTQYFASLICADAISTPIAELLSKSFGKNLLLFNPQLNPKPYADDFKTFRLALYQAQGIKTCRLISLNWAAGTSINDKQVKLSAFPGSSITIPTKDRPNDEFRSRHFVSLRKRNRVKGLYQFYNDMSHNWVWRIHPNELIMNVLINNPDAVGQNHNLAGCDEPECRHIFMFNTDVDSQKFNRCEIVSCDNSFQDLILSDANYVIPFQCSKNEGNECISQGCRLIYCDYFFGLCFGDIKYDGTDLDNERGKCITYVLDGDNMEKRSEQLTLLNIMIQKLIKNEIPDSLEYLKGNNRFDIDENAVDTGSNQIFNLTPISGATYKKAIVAICDTYSESKIKNLYNKLFDITHQEYRDQIIIYYRDQNTQQFIPYDEPHKQSSIKHSSLTRNPTSIR